jgi:hypothetical protein
MQALSCVISAGGNHRWARQDMLLMQEVSAADLAVVVWLACNG